MHGDIVKIGTAICIEVISLGVGGEGREEVEGYAVIR